MQLLIFNLYFPTHFFKVFHSIQSDNIIGDDRLAAWLRYNPYLTVLDVGCGDGAGSVAIIAALLRLREEGKLDPQRIKVYCIGLDPNPRGLMIYKHMLEETSKLLIEKDIDVKIEPILSTISDGLGKIEQYLYKLRHDQWLQPSLSHSILIMSNLVDILHAEHIIKAEAVKEFKNYGLDIQDPFGDTISSFITNIFEGVPIDHLHLISIDTRPERIQSAINQMVASIQSRTTEKRHSFEHGNVKIEEIQFENPKPGYWSRRRPDTQISPFLIFTGNIHNQDLAADINWLKISCKENLELAWARARQEMLKAALCDEIEIRLFEQDLISNLDRLEYELEGYAIHAGYIKQILPYHLPKNSEKDRPLGLSCSRRRRS